MTLEDLLHKARAGPVPCLRLDRAVADDLATRLRQHCKSHDPYEAGIYGEKPKDGLPTEEPTNETTNDLCEARQHFRRLREGGVQVQVLSLHVAVLTGPSEGPSIHPIWT